MTPGVSPNVYGLSLEEKGAKYVRGALLGAHQFERLGERISN